MEKLLQISRDQGLNDAELNELISGNYEYQAGLLCCAVDSAHSQDMIEKCKRKCIFFCFLGSRRGYNNVCIIKLIGFIC